jgi:DNA invertase Pin-like site-specific DNA recombinase
VGEATTVILTRETTQRARVGRTHRSARDRSSSNTANGQPLNDTAATGGSGSMFSTGGLASLVVGLILGIVLSLSVLGDRTTRTPRAGTGRAAPVLPRVIAGGPEAPSAKGPPVLGYATVRPDAGEGRRDDLKAQLAAIHNECRRRGLELVDVVREHEPERAKGLKRPGLGYALRRIAHGDARGLVIADLWRVSRSVTDVGEVLEWFSRTGTRLVAAEPPLDTGEHEGQLAAMALMNVSNAERQRLSERTRKGLEAAKRQQTQRGRAAVADDPELSEHIARMRAEGMTLQAIADRLNEEGVPTIRGGVKWRPSSVQASLGYRRPRAAPGGPRMEFGGANNGEGGASM